MRSIFALLALCLCLQAQADKPKQICRHFTVVVPWTLDPHLENHANVLKLQAQMFESPLEMGLDPKGRIKIQPSICGMPQISRDGKQIKLTVRPGIRFHDDDCFKDKKGREITADDVKYMFMRHADPGVQSRYFASFVEGRFKGLDAWRARAEAQGFADYEANIAGLAVEGNTITLGLTDTYPQLYSLLTQPWASIVPKEALARYGSGFGDHPVGSGPFMLESKDALGTITFVKNPTYRIPGKPAIDELRFENVPNLDDRTKRFRNGDLDVLDVWSHNHDELFDRFGKVRSEFARKGAWASRGTEMEISYLFFNFKNKLLQKENVRKAICLALDRHSFVKAAWGPVYKLADIPFPSTFPESALFDFAAPYKFGKRNKKEAERLLAEAGHAGGKGLPEFIVDFPGYVGPKEKAAYALFERDMTAVGIKVQMRESTFDEFMERAKNGDLQIGWVRWYADYPDVENFLILFRSNDDPMANWNYGGFKSEEYDKLYDAMCKLYPGAERNQLVRKMVKIVQDECPWVMLYYSRYDRLVAKHVKGYRYNVMNLSMRDVRIDHGK